MDFSSDALSLGNNDSLPPHPLRKSLMVHAPVYLSGQRRARLGAYRRDARQGTEGQCGVFVVVGNLAMEVLSKLWAIADRVATEGNMDADYVFDPCGLILQRPVKRWDYFCTPQNSLTFASTGGNGVHFSILEISTINPKIQPIIMTVPTGTKYNTVVAGNIEDFLDLGFNLGWFSLEQLAYNIEEAIIYYSQSQELISNKHDELLAILRDELKLTHLPLTLEYLEDLQHRFETLIEVDLTK